VKSTQNGFLGRPSQTKTRTDPKRHHFQLLQTFQDPLKVRVLLWAYGTSPPDPSRPPPDPLQTPSRPLPDPLRPLSLKLVGPRGPPWDPSTDTPDSLFIWVHNGDQVVVLWHFKGFWPILGLFWTHFQPL
jgi:hypothetical protein